MRKPRSATPFVWEDTLIGALFGEDVDPDVGSSLLSVVSEDIGSGVISEAPVSVSLPAGFPSFDDFYFGVHKRRPFPWQRRLAILALQDAWPTAIALPTSMGKTSVVDVAVYHLASQADMGHRTAAMRTFVAVNRHVVVDDIYRHACEIAAALEDPQSEAVAEVARCLRMFRLDGGAPLTVGVLRGGTYRDDAWLQAPNNPTIVATTIDQVGSSLLFRGYGIPSRKRPIAAGLVGVDSRIFLDEAPLSTPFADTVQAVCKMQAEAPVKLEVPHLSLIQMSATLKETTAFYLDDEDRNDKTLSSRLLAKKLAKLEVVADKDFEAHLAATALRAIKEGHEVVGVFVNRVGTARKILSKLQGEVDVLLLTGQSREYDRALLWSQYEMRLRTGHQRGGVPLVVVATQTLEVGADIDFDFLVTEAASWDALVQRFGRLNRLGFWVVVNAHIVMRTSAAAEDADPDPIYGTSLRSTWRFLIQNAVDDTIDLGINAIRSLTENVDLTDLVRASDKAPVLLPVHVATLVQTAPAPNPDVLVAPFLHGRDALDDGDVRVVWRADLDSEDPNSWRDIVSMAPPMSGEVLALPFVTARKWLLQGQADLNSSDLSGTLSNTDPNPSVEGSPKQVLVWFNPNDSWVANAGTLRPGCTIVVPSSYGGCDKFGFDAACTVPVQDVGDAVLHQNIDAGGRRKRRWRLHPTIMPACKAEVTRLLEALTTADSEEGWIEQAWQAVQVTAGLTAFDVRFVTYPDNSGIVVFEKSGVSSDEYNNDDDDGNLGQQRIPLQTHNQDVGTVAEKFAKACGLPAPFLELFRQTGLAHDLGKADPRMQGWLYDGDVAASRRGPLVAKSGLDWRNREAIEQARVASQYPRGARHEAQSVALLLANPTAMPVVSDPDLLLVLVGTHHGHGRPFMPVAQPSRAVSVSVEFNNQVLQASSEHRLDRLGSVWPDLFYRVLRRYGPWGLAWLEAVIRLADHRASAIEEAGGTL